MGGAGIKPRQRQLLEATSRFWKSKGYGPTLSDLASAVGLKARSTVHYHLRSLRSEGLLTNHSASTWTLTDEGRLVLGLPAPCIETLPAMVLAVEQHWSFEERLLLFVATHVQANGKAPSFREVGEHFGISLGMTSTRVARLRAAGYLTESEPNKARTLGLTVAGWQRLRRAPV